MWEQCGVGPPWAVGDKSSADGGWLPMALRIAWTGLVCGGGNVPCVDVRKLGFICFSVMTPGLNGCTPVASKAALTLSGVNACRNTYLKTPAQSPLPTPTICKSSNSCISS